MGETTKREIRLAVRGLYDLQKIRIQIGNRLHNHYLNKLGIKPSEEKDKTIGWLTERLKEEHKRIVDGMLHEKNLIKNLSRILGTEKGLISTETEFALSSAYLHLCEDEERQIKFLKKLLEDIPIYNSFLKEVKGVGPQMAGVIISEFDITKAKYVSSLWKYAGLDVVVTADGEVMGRRMSKKCCKVIEYIAKSGEKKERLSLTYNPFLKSKLLGVLAKSFIKLKSPYRKFYDDYKHRLQNHPKHKNKSKGHIDNMAKRYMIKMFLIDLYVKWRELSGLPVHPSYAEGKLGIKHKID